MGLIQLSYLFFFRHVGHFVENDGQGRRNEFRKAIKIDKLHLEIKRKE